MVGFASSVYLQVAGPGKVVTPNTIPSAGVNAYTPPLSRDGVVLSDRPTTVTPPTITPVPPVSSVPPAITPAPYVPPSPASVPRISSISPASGVVGTTVTLRGTNLLSASGTVVHFGSGVVLASISSSTGELTFQVPSGLDPACATATPACLLPTTQVVPGSYQVSVSNANGRSNTLSFQVLAGEPVKSPSITPTTTTTTTCSATGFTTAGLRCGCGSTSGFSKTTGLSCSVTDPNKVDRKVLGASSYTFTQKLQLGSTGSEVTQLQLRLNTLGYDAGVADGTFGAKTQSAVVKLQLANGLTPDGVVGDETRNVLN